jgi:hypothetical protein
MDGPLRNIPERQEFCPFCDDAVKFAPVKVDRWEQFYFVNLDVNAGPLLEILGGVPRRVAAYKPAVRAVQVVVAVHGRPVQLEDRAGRVPGGLPRPLHPPRDQQLRRLHRQPRRADR